MAGQSKAFNASEALTKKQVPGTEVEVPGTLDAALVGRA
jgi:hypothetical protein